MRTMLEDMLQPQRLFWLVHCEMENADTASLAACLEHIEQCVSRHTASTAPYLKEVIKVWAAIWLRLNVGVCTSAGAFKFGDTIYVGMASPVLSLGSTAQLCEELVHGADPRTDAMRLCMYQFALTRVRAMDRQRDAVDEEPATGFALAASTLRKIITRYAPECTFKTRGDNNVHCELILGLLPAWLSCAMVHHEMPYPLAVKAFPDGVNRVLRPLLDCPVVEKLLRVEWAPQNDTLLNVSDFVTLFCLIIEIAASKDVLLLTNCEVLKHTNKPWPLPYVWRGPDGTIEHGVRADGVLHVFPPTTSAVATCVQWLRMCQDAGVGACKNLFDLVLDPAGVEERNPLRKYLL